jgi:hypothetical protein
MTCRPSEACSPASAASTSASSEPAGSAASRSSGTSSASESSPSTGPMFPDLETSTGSTRRAPARWPTPTVADSDGRTLRQRSTDPLHKPGGRHAMSLDRAVAEGSAPTASRPSTFSLEASPASRSASQGSSAGWRTIVGYGPSSHEPFASYDPASSSWRTSQASLWEAEWTPYSETWPSSGMTRNGRAFPRRPLVPRTSVTGSGLWPTPQARDFRSVTGREHEQRDNHLQNLNVAVVYRDRWPTPTARDHKDDQFNPNVPINGLLGRAVWPTPRASEAAHSGRVATGHGGQVGLSEAVGTGSLNPTWVELLMGFPPGWTDVESDW